MSAAREIATAVAHPNIALSKYWGKLDGDMLPATPSLSLTVGPFHTRTTVQRSAEPGLRARINGLPVSALEQARLKRVLEALSELGGADAVGLDMRSVNDFPTSSGLASSASGLAAFTCAAGYLLGVEASTEQLATAAARGSLSAARSFFGGAVEMTVRDARLCVAPAPTPLVEQLRLVAAVLTEAPKAVSSSEGMRRTRAHSPYYDAWTASAAQLHGVVVGALRAGDFEALGRAAEASSQAMHGAALGAGVLYMHERSMAIVGAVRDKALPAYASFDAGPHPKFLCLAEHAVEVQAFVASLPGVLRAVVLRPSEGARVVEG